MISYETEKNGTETFAVVTGGSVRMTALDVPACAAGLPVRAVAAHAFAGETALKSVSLPDSIVTLGSFAFHNCAALRDITMYDSVTDYGDGVIRQCTSLSDVYLTMRRENYALVSRMLADCDNTLTVSLYLPEGRACLTFPGYNYDFTENTMARTIQFNIEGSGMAFRECVSRTGIDYAAYDRTFHRAKLDDITITAKLVLNRLMHPCALSGQAAADYEDYVRAHAEDVLKTLIVAKDIAGVRFLTSRRASALLHADAVRSAVQLASAKNLPEMTALLTECVSWLVPSARRRRLSL